MVLHVRAADPALSAQVRDAFHEIESGLPLVRLYRCAHMRTSLVSAADGKDAADRAGVSLVDHPGAGRLVQRDRVCRQPAAARAGDPARVRAPPSGRWSSAFAIREGAFVVGISVALGSGDCGVVSGISASPLLLGMPAFDALAFGGASLTLTVLAMGSALPLALARGGSSRLLRYAISNPSSLLASSAELAPQR